MLSNYLEKTINEVVKISLKINEDDVRNHLKLGIYFFILSFNRIDDLFNDALAKSKTEFPKKKTDLGNDWKRT